MVLRFAYAALLGFTLCGGCASDRRPQALHMTQRRNIDSVLAEHAPKLMEIQGVVGVYHGETEKKEPCLKVMVEKRTEALAQRIPKSLEGYPVFIEESGVIRPLKE